MKQDANEADSSRPQGTNQEPMGGSSSYNVAEPTAPSTRGARKGQGATLKKKEGGTPGASQIQGSSEQAQANGKTPAASKRPG